VHTASQHASAPVPSILLIQTAFIGDVVLSFHTIEALRAAHPHARIGLLTTPAAAPLARCVAALDDVIVFDKRGSQSGLGGMMRVARRVGEYHSVLAAHRSLRTTLVVWLATLLGATRFTAGFETAAAAWLYHKRVRYHANNHEIERVLELVSALPEPLAEGTSTDVSPSSQSVATIIPATDLEAASELLRGLLPPFIAIAPGSVWATKRWREEHFIVAATAAANAGTVLLLGGNDDRELCERIAHAHGQSVVSLAGKTTLPQMLAVLQRSSVLLCNDSAPLHIANLAGCRVVALFGPTVPSFGFAPRGANDRVLEIPSSAMPCRPCSPHGTHTCPLGTHACMRELAPETAIDAVLNGLETMK
jgi:heptosyltransferase II